MKSENVTNYDTPKNLIERRNCILQRLTSANFFIHAQTFLIIAHTLNESIVSNHIWSFTDIWSVFFILQFLL